MREKAKVTAADRLREKYQRGIVPTRESNVYRVTCTAIPIPDWARENAPEDFSAGPLYAWLKHRSKANLLAALDRTAGGKGEVLKVEMRRCMHCGAVYLDEEARALRKQIESHRHAWKLYCGPQCKRLMDERKARKEGWLK